VIVVVEKWTFFSPQKIKKRKVNFFLSSNLELKTIILPLGLNTRPQQSYNLQIYKATISSREDFFYKASRGGTPPPPHTHTRPSSPRDYDKVRRCPQLQKSTTLGLSFASSQEW
jgi:hypothetical protein